MDFAVKNLNFNNNSLSFGKAKKAPAIKPETAQKHETYAKLAQDCASDKGDGFIEGYERKYNIIDHKTGFNSAIYKKIGEDEVVVAYRCTDNKEGVASDVQMVEGKLPYQYKDSLAAYYLAKKMYPYANITVIGHSLGGSLAQLTASTFKDAKAIAFDPFGTDMIIKECGLKDNNNCLNYTTKGSIVSGVTPHPGVTRTIDISEDEEYKQCHNPKDKIVKLHSLDNYSDLEKGPYANEAKVERKRNLNYDRLIRPVATYLQVMPNSEAHVAEFFFND